MSGEEELFIHPEAEDTEPQVEGEADAVAHQSTDEEFSDLKRQVQQMQEEAEKLEEIQKEVEAQMGGTPSTTNSQSIDARSVYVGNVDYAVTPQELQAHFQSCGPINRITILCDKFTGHPKGYAYIEFSEEDAVGNAVLLNDTLVHGRQLKVNPKRTNVPGFNRGGYRGRGGRGFRGGFRGRGGRGRGSYYHPYQ